MELYIEKTINTPYIKFVNGEMFISGRSIPENAILFFEPLFRSIVEYSKNPCDQTLITVFLEYANSSTNRALLTVFTLLENMFEKGLDIKVYWYYEPEDDMMRELGNDFKTILTLPICLEERSNGF